VDEYDLAEPSQVVGELGRDWWANLQEKKWSIRKGALTSLKTLASKPRLAPGDYSEINRELKKVLFVTNATISSGLGRSSRRTATCSA